MSFAKDGCVLIVGGAGYIGSHTAKCLNKKGYRLIVLDNLFNGHAEFVKWGEFVNGDMGCPEIINSIFEQNKVIAVMHFAAYACVGESVANPRSYYENNVRQSLSLLNSMLDHGVNRLIFSSTCATYGNPLEIPIRESHSQFPVNPYGRSKLMLEQILSDYDSAYGLKHVCLRYFNAAGADPDGDIGEWHTPETHLIPRILEVASGRSESLQIHGGNYETPDGTCIRDYIHVTDLAEAHVLALEYLLNNDQSDAFNLGNGKGYSVKEVVAACEEITARIIKTEISQPRAGDPSVLIGSSEKIMRSLGWRPDYPDIRTIVETAWKWHLKMTAKR